MKKFIIQNNLIAENDLNEIQLACKKHGIEYHEVKVIPFTEDLPEFPIDEDNIYYGSTTFITNVYNKLKPKGVFFDPNQFLISNYLNKWGQHMLNHEATFTTFSKVVNEPYEDSDEFFIRPNADDKSFEGQVMEFRDIKNWQKKLTQFDNINLLGDVEILISPAYNIAKEWRNIIVDGKIVTSSLYRKYFRLNKSAIDIPESMLNFVQERISEYTPAKAFAMDIALCGEEYYIIECGCINSVGFYHCDIEKIIVALNKIN